MRCRFTDAEWEYITSIADNRGISMSEALRWLVHQSVLLTTLLLEEPETVKRARKFLLEMPHLKEVKVETT